MDVPWPALLVVGEVVWVVVIGTVVVLERRTAAATMAWLLALAFLPIVGFLVYRLIGPRRLQRRKLARASSRRAVAAAMAGLAEARSSAPGHARLTLVPVGAGEAPPLAAWDITAHTDGRSTYAAILEAIAAARHHLHLEYYIWEPDRIGTRLRDALVARARAGVEVRVIIDGTGASKLGKRFLAPMRAAGIEIKRFNPVSLASLRRRRIDFRTHRKIVVCDGELAFTGGMNVCEPHSEEFGPRYWRDTHLSFRGPAVAALQRVFFEDWVFTGGTLPEAWSAYFPTPAAPAGADVDAVQIVSSGPDTEAFAIHKTLFAAFNSARDRLWITTPYFIPDEAITSALCVAALSRVDVRVLVPARGDSRVVDLAARSYFDELLRAGVRIFEFDERFVHAKTAVIDDELTVVGTANLDNRSFRLNFEVAAVVYGTALNLRLARAFEVDLGAAREVTLEALARRSFGQRLGQAAARLLSPLL